MRDIRILITGGNGFLGRHVCQIFRAEAIEVLAPGSNSLDLLDAPKVLDYVSKNRPTHIVHLAAACGGIGANIEQPAHFLHANSLMGLNLLEAARKSDVHKFILISTTCAYPEDAPMPLDEATIWNGLPTSATRAYGLAKRFLHEAIVQYRMQYELDGSVLIPANLYGPGDHYDERSHVVAAMIRRFENARLNQLPSVTNWGTGTATREFLHVRDAARAILIACFAKLDSHPINLGTGIETSIRELSDTIAEIVGYRGNVFWDSSKPNGQPRRCLNIEAAKKIGFEAEVPLHLGLEETIADYRENYP